MNKQILPVLVALALIGGGAVALLSARPISAVATAESLAKLLLEQGPDRALAEAKSVISRRGFDDGACHVVMHRLGRAAYRHFGDLAKALGSGEKASGVGACSAGYVHGMIEAYFAGVADPVAAAPAVCDRYRSVNAELYGNCTHGIGHGFMFFTDNDLPESLALCGRLPTGQPACAGGVFMENFNASKGIGHDLFYPCAEQAQYQKQCYFYSADHFLAYHQKDYQKLISWCGGAGSEEFTGECVIRAGNRAFLDLYPDQKTPSFICSLAPEQYKGNCFEGIARGYKYFFNDTAKAVDFCRNILDPRYHKYCPAQYQ